MGRLQGRLTLPYSYIACYNCSASDAYQHEVTEKAALSPKKVWPDAIQLAASARSKSGSTISWRVPKINSGLIAVYPVCLHHDQGLWYYCTVLSHEVTAYPSLLSKPPTSRLQPSRA